MPAQLVALTEGPNILLDKPILLLGRHPECDIQLNSRKISRRHCIIAQVDSYLVVRDLGSTNGIRVNGVRVLEGKLKTGDELTIGNFRYQITFDDRPASAPIKPAKSPKPALPASLPRTIPEEDDILESCDEPVPLGKPKPDPRTPDSPPVGEPPSLPLDLSLREDSGMSLQPPR